MYYVQLDVADGDTLVVGWLWRVTLRVESDPVTNEDSIVPTK